MSVRIQMDSGKLFWGWQEGRGRGTGGYLYAATCLVRVWCLHPLDVSGGDFGVNVQDERFADLRSPRGAPSWSAVRGCNSVQGLKKLKVPARSDRGAGLGEIHVTAMVCGGPHL